MNKKEYLEILELYAEKEKELYELRQRMREGNKSIPIVIDNPCIEVQMELKNFLDEETYKIEETDYSIKRCYYTNGVKFFALEEWKDGGKNGSISKTMWAFDEP